ncbi:50S ribosomal protein L22 [bacterium]|nr:50S ribosomal protein L22 [bacterium]MCP5463249.1 50S ribosomal protein L22 [bacterium]
MQAKAVWKFARMSPRKLRLIADAIRGKNVNTAVNIIRFTNKKAAPMVEKVLKSAIANAENLNEANIDSLVVSKIYIDGGPMLKRFRPRAMGRAARIRKRTSHITIVLESNA